MTPEQFKLARRALGYSQRALAAEWGMGDNGGRTIRRWESGSRPMNPVAAYAICCMEELMQNYFQDDSR
jgi:transcriptional regulator with XRE-family HTH domain